MIDRIQRVYGNQPIERSAPKKRSEGVQGGSSDAVSVSSFARELAQATGELKKLPEVRQDRVEDLRRQVESGTYQPDLKAVAARLVWAGILKPED